MRTWILTLAATLAACGQGTVPEAPAGAPTPDATADDGPEPADVLTPVDATRIRSIEDAGAPGEIEEDALDDPSLAVTAANIRYRAREVPGYPGLYEFILNNTGSGWQEKFLLQVPPTPPTSPVPLLVVFHKYGSSHGDVLTTTFPAETQARGWYCLAPLGARQKNFGNMESQINTRAALQLVRHLFPIDESRVYGVGFSMGGGGLTNYAARHQNPDDIRFAALCQHTGSVSLVHTWFNEPDDDDSNDNLPTPGANLEVPDVLEEIFGGPPSVRQFTYQRFSSIDLDPGSGTIGAGTDFARNLNAVPVLTWIANNDPIAYLQNQTYAFESHAALFNPVNQLHVASGVVHSWSTMDETFVCDWLQQFTLQSSTSGNILADENGVWHHFQVEQDSAGAFTPISWSLTAPSTLEVGATANLRRLIVDAPGLGLVLQGAVTLRISTADGAGDYVRILGVTVPPTQVLRDGQAASGTYDSLTQSFEIAESDGAMHEWRLSFP